MHVAAGNFMLLGTVGVEAAPDLYGTLDPAVVPRMLAMMTRHEELEKSIAGLRCSFFGLPARPDIVRVSRSCRRMHRAAIFRRFDLNPKVRSMSPDGDGHQRDLSRRGTSLAGDSTACEVARFADGVRALTQALHGGGWHARMRRRFRSGAARCTQSP